MPYAGGPTEVQGHWFPWFGQRMGPELHWLLPQGLCKFGFYEVFKVWYSNMLGEENACLWHISPYLAASSSAEFFADIALAPMEAAKV